MLHTCELGASLVRRRGVVASAGGQTTDMTYRYPHFYRKLLYRDLKFEGGRRPGQAMPEFDLPTSDGGRVRKSDFVGDRPLFLTFASVT